MLLSLLLLRFSLAGRATVRVAPRKLASTQDKDQDQDQDQDLCHRHGRGGSAPCAPHCVACSTNFFFAYSIVPHLNHPDLACFPNLRATIIVQVEVKRHAKNEHDSLGIRIYTDLKQNTMAFLMKGLILAVLLTHRVRLVVAVVVGTPQPVHQLAEAAVVAAVRDVGRGRHVPLHIAWSRTNDKATVVSCADTAILIATRR